MLRDPATGQLDAQRQQRFMFSLKMQLARSNWLLGAQADGIAAEFRLAREPVLVLTVNSVWQLSITRITLWNQPRMMDRLSIQSWFWTATTIRRFQNGFTALHDIFLRSQSSISIALQNQSICGQEWSS